MPNDPDQQPDPLEKSLGDQATGSDISRSDEERSLGDQATGADVSRVDRDMSLGDQSTTGDALSSQSDISGDLSAELGQEMPIVDLTERYEIQDLLGKGGMGEVLRALDTRLERPVAIKRMLGEMAHSKKALARFLTEAKSIAALSHTNIVQIYDYGRDPDGPFIIMELVAGKSLLEKLKEGKLKIEEAVDLACQLCDALGKAHDAGIIHRDIKPANILLTEDGVPKLTDFGLARQETADHGQTQAGVVLGTIDFMPPEQRRDATATDARSDLWSLAATLYQMVTGKSPKVIRLQDVPSQLRDVISQALEEDPAERYQDAADLSEALQASLQQSDDRMADLGKGECPSCGTTNESSRKFCRNCAASLEVACLSCGVEMPMWEEVCGNCGTRQSDLAENRRAAMASQQEQAEDLLKRYDFAAAGEIATALSDESDLRFQHLKSWAEQFLQDVEQEREQQLQRMSELLQEALQHEEAYDYRSGINTLEQVAEILRQEPLRDHPSGVDEVLARLTDKQTASERLEKSILERVKSRELGGLLGDVESLLTLRPDHRDMLTVKQHLLKREEKLAETRDMAWAAAQQLFAEQDYKGCLSELTKIDASLVTAEMEELRKRSKATRARLKELNVLISAAVKEKQLHGLLKPVEEYLSLKPAAEKMKKLQEQLIKRDKQNAVQIAGVVKTAQGLRSDCRFDEAGETLRRIPQQQQTQQLINLLEDCESLSTTRATALDALQQAQQTRRFFAGLQEADMYQTILAAQGLDDRGFAAQYRACQEALQQHKVEVESTKKRQAARKKLVIAGSVTAAVLLLLVAALWMKSSMHSSAVATAVRQQQWWKVLELDSENLVALIGRAKKRLVVGGWDPQLKGIRNRPDIDGAFADLAAAERIDSSAEGLQEAKGLAFATRANVKAQANQISEAEDDLQEAERLGAEEASLLATKQSLGWAHLRGGETMLTDGNPDAALAAADTAEQLGVPPSQLSKLRLGAYATRGKQLGKSGDLDAAMVAFKEVTIRGGLVSEATRASLYVNLGQHALAANDFPKAAEHLSVAVSLDRSVPGVLKLATGLVEPAVALFETDASDANRDAALAGLKEILALNFTLKELATLQSRVAAVIGRPVAAFEQDPTDAKRDKALSTVNARELLNKNIVDVSRLKARVASVLLRRAAANAKVGTLDSAVADCKQGLALQHSQGDELGEDPKLTLETKTAVVSALRARFLAALSEKDIQKAGTDHGNIAILDAITAKVLAAEYAKLPADVIAKFPGDVILKLPGDVLAKLPGDVILKLPALSNSVGMQMKLLPSGTFTMGDTLRDGNTLNAAPAHKVTLTKPFYLGVHEVTQQQYVQIMVARPWRGRKYVKEGADYVATYVSWHDAVQFCRKLSSKEGVEYRLPTEAEWEYACRAGTTTAYSFGDDASKLGQYGWYDKNSFDIGETIVGQKLPNPWGLYDMHGNVLEWCHDWTAPYGSEKVVSDPMGPAQGERRLLRGGACTSRPSHVRSAYRYWESPSANGVGVGFRVARTYTLSP